MRCLSFGPSVPDRQHIIYPYVPLYERAGMPFSGAAVVTLQNQELFALRCRAVATPPALTLRMRERRADDGAKGSGLRGAGRPDSIWWLYSCLGRSS